jgi:DNA-directed RNA polymerase alpha subunit
MPIAKLLQDQEIAFDATAVLGLGKEHAKWSPGLIYYKHVPNIVIKKQPENKKEIVEQCPKKVFEIKNDTLLIDQKRLFDCDLCDQCVELSKGAIEIKKEDEYVLSLETWGQLSPDEIVIKAIDVFNDQLKEFDKLIKEI